jgi:hypothetical protein
VKAFSGLILCVLCCCGVAVGFFFEDILSFGRDWSKSEEVLVSAADGTCAQLWVNGARNDPALLCYLSHDVERLCKTSEKMHLAYTMKRYLSDKTDFEDKLRRFTLSVPATLNAEGPIFKADGSPEDPMLEFNRVARQKAEELKAQGFDKALKLDSALDKDIQAMIWKLGERGLIQKSDFGWSPGYLVESAFQNHDNVPVRTCS